MLKYLSFSLIGAVLATAANAETLQRIKTVNSLGKGTPALVCVGDAKTPARFGGIQTDSNGQATIMLPDRLRDGSALPKILVTAKGTAGGAQKSVDMMRPVSELVFKLDPKSSATCGKVKIEPAPPVPGFKGVENIIIIRSPDPGLSPKEVNERLTGLNLLPLEKLSSFTGQAATPPASPPPVTRPITERCFGAAGSQCGILAGMDGISTCVGVPFVPNSAVCTVNEGSWRHDECCVRNPNGYFCGGAPAGPDAICGAEMNEALALNFSPFSWRRVVDPNLVNRTGRVDAPLYCARSGSVVFEDHTPRCCNGSRDLNGFDVAAFIAREGAWATMLPLTKVCR